MDARRQYNILLKSGDLLELYPELTGKWSKDKEVFTELFETMTRGVIDLDYTDEDL
jgi:hypothetical protein